MSQAPQIKRLPNDREIKKLVETIITPELADTQCKALIELLAAVSSPESEQQFELAEIAMIHSFSFTMAHEEALRSFSGGAMEGFQIEPETQELTGSIA